jgi:hypothetical protein
MLSWPIQRNRSRTGSTQANKLDWPVFRSSFGELPRMFPRVVPSAIVHVNGHHLCDPVSDAVIALLINAFQFLINEGLFIIFLSMRQIGKLQESVGSDKYCDHHFFRAYRRSHSWNDRISGPCQHCRRIIIGRESTLVSSHEMREILALVLSQCL